MEHVILANLLDNENYTRKVLPFLKTEYFSSKTDKILFEAINEYIGEYNVSPTREALDIIISDLNIGQSEYNEIAGLVSELKIDTDTAEQWLIDETEKFCQDRSIFNAIHSSIEIMEDKEGKLSKNAIPEILSEALAVSFDNNIGHDFIANAEGRYEFYNTDEVKIPFDIDYLNKITGGGLVRKSLTTFMAGTGVGKSIIMCHMAAHNLKCNYNVLYITLEMSEEKIAQRIDANLMDIDIGQTQNISHDDFMKNIKRIDENTKGRLIIKEYGPGSASAANFKHLLGELKLKKKFVPDIIYIDYINLCASSRLKQTGNINSYNYVKAVAEELRSMGVEYVLPIVTATQLNRGGIGSSDVGLDNTSESMGLPMTTDLMLAAISTEELQDMGVIIFKQLKNRYNDVNYYRKFAVGLNKSKMRLHDVDDENLENKALGRVPEVDDDDDLDTPVMDNGHFAEEDRERKKKTKSFFGTRDFK